MEKFWTIFLTIIIWTIFVVVVFSVTVLIASALNKVGFYDQLCIWFGHGSNFEKIFLK